MGTSTEPGQNELHDSPLINLGGAPLRLRRTGAGHGRPRGARRHRRATRGASDPSADGARTAPDRGCRPPPSSEYRWAAQSRPRRLAVRARPNVVVPLACVASTGLRSWPWGCRILARTRALGTSSCDDPQRLPVSERVPGQRSGDGRSADDRARGRGHARVALDAHRRGVAGGGSRWRRWWSCWGRRYQRFRLMPFVSSWAALLLVFGLRWLRKAILRAAGSRLSMTRRPSSGGVGARRRAVPDRRAVRGLRTRSHLAFKGVLFEGLEVAFIVVTFGAAQSKGGRDRRRRGGGGVRDRPRGRRDRRGLPLSRVPENTLEFRGWLDAHELRDLLGPARAPGVTMARGRRLAARDPRTPARGPRC